MEMVIKGVSTRKVSQITEELCGTEFYKSTVTEMCKKLDPIVNAWKNRDLREKCYTFVLVDAFVLKIRVDCRVRSRSAMIAIGIYSEGYR